MVEALLSPLAAWQNYYIIIGTAAATLTGLLFVVIALVSGALGRVSSPWSGVRVFSNQITPVAAQLLDQPSPPDAPVGDRLRAPHPPRAMPPH